MNSSEEAFIWKDLIIHQNNSVLKVGTDSILLGSWIPTVINKAESILDVGTGTGILAMILCKAYPNALVEAIDHDDNAVKLASQNFQNSDDKERLSVRYENLFQPELSKHKEFELIVSNPPYYFEQYTTGLKAAVGKKHAKESSSKWIKALAERMKSNGHLFLVLPYDLSFDWIRCANEEGFYCIHRMDVYSYGTDINPKRSLLHLTDILAKPCMEKLVLYGEKNKFTEEYILFSGIKSLKKENLSVK